MVLQVENKLDTYFSRQKISFGGFSRRSIVLYTYRGCCCKSTSKLQNQMN